MLRLCFVARACAGAHKLAASLVQDVSLEEKRAAMCNLHAMLFGCLSDGNRAAAEAHTPLLRPAPCMRFH